MKALKFFVLATLLAALPFAVAADEGDTSTNETKGSIEVGGLFTDVTDSPDMAAEFTELTKNQILQQAGTAVLGQANQLAQSVLSLLQ